MPIQLTAEQRASLTAAQPTSPAMARRLQALLLLAEGHHITQVAQEVQVSCRSVHTWLKHYREQGIAGLAERQHPGRPSRVKAHYIDCLNAALTQVALFPRDGWSIDTLRAHLSQQTGIQLSATRLYCLLADLGYASRHLVITQKGKPVAAGHTWMKCERRGRGKQMVFWERISG